MFDRDSKMIWESYTKTQIKLVKENAATSGMNMPPGLASSVTKFELEDKQNTSEFDSQPNPETRPRFGATTNPSNEEVYTDEEDDEDEEEMVSFKEAFNEVGALATRVSPEKVSQWMADTHAKKEYLDRSKATPEQIRKYNAMKASRPILHKGNVGVFEIVNNEGHTIKTYDLDGYKKLLMQRPDYLLGSNDKMQKSGGESQEFYNTTLPAIMGIAVNETTGELILVNTCPAAGECKNDCYARNGNYIRQKGPSIRQQRILNFILNDYDGYKEQLKAELYLNFVKNKKLGVKTVLRFNDSGDMLSNKYFEMCADLARSMPEVLFYGYTKSVGIAKALKLPENFVMNYSMGGKEDVVINTSDKQSIIVYPKKVQEKTGINLDKLIRKEWYIEDEVNLKKGISKRFGIPINRIFTVKEVQNAGNLELPKNSAIVKLPDEEVSNYPETQIIDVLQKDPLKPNKKLTESMAGIIKNKNIYNGGAEIIQKFKQTVANFYKVNPEKLLTLDELKETPVGKTNEYNVMVLPLESDLSASRRDVHITFLYLH